MSAGKATAEALPAAREYPEVKINNKV